MKTITLLFTLIFISVAGIGITQAEDCATSFYCYGNTNPQNTVGTVRLINSNNVRTNTSTDARPIPNQTRQSSCLQSYNTLIDKAKKLDELATAQTRANRLDQAKRLLNNAVTLRNTAAKLPCKPSA